MTWIQALGSTYLCFTPTQLAARRWAPAPFSITISTHLYFPQGGGQEGFSDRNGGDTADREGKSCAETVGQALPTHYSLHSEDKICIQRQMN